MLTINNSAIPLTTNRLRIKIFSYPDLSILILVLPSQKFNEICLSLSNDPADIWLINQHYAGYFKHF